MATSWTAATRGTVLSAAEGAAGGGAIMPFEVTFSDLDITNLKVTP